MSRFNEYNNIFDADDDGEDIEITYAEVQASDDQGREEAATLIRTGNSVQGTGKYAEQQRRMFLRWAQKALADGAERREEAAASARAQREAEEREERERADREAKDQQRRGRFERSMRESDERWARLNGETARLEAEWKAGAPERDRAQREAAARKARMSPPTSPWSTPAPVPRPPRAQERPHTRNPPPASPAAAPKIPSTAPSPPPRASWGSSALARPSQAPESLQPPSQLPVLPSTVAQPAPQPSCVTGKPKPAPQSTRQRPPVPSARSPRTPLHGAPPSAGGASRPSLAAAPVSPTHMSAERATLTLTGADLVRWRTASGITQRAAAELLGVAPSTVAKAELLPTKALGDALAVALRAHPRA
jgi:hypothetical protein